MTAKYYNFFINLSILIIVLSLLLLIGELMTRIIQLAKYQRPMFVETAKPIRYDKKIGWKSKENYFFNGTKKDADGNNYKVIITTNNLGFRYFSKYPNNKINLFFVGDSFTHALDVSDNKTYYALISQRFNDTAVFAYGAIGYGTLQEYMIIDEYINLIKPNIIILQMCTNDIIDNDYGLQLPLLETMHGGRRPFLNDQGNIIYKRTGYVPDLLLKHFRLLYSIDWRLTLLQSIIKNKLFNDKDEIITLKDIHKSSLFNHALNTTKNIMELIKQRAPGILLLSFCADNNQPAYDKLKEISESLDIKFIDGIPQSNKKCEANGLCVTAEDGEHWNELGHQIAADKIIEYFQKNNVLVKSKKSKWQ
jgi:hypothetical protein